MTDEENLAFETMRAALVAEERTVARLRASLKVAQQDEVHWREYYIAAVALSGDPFDIGDVSGITAAQTADLMLETHRSHWRS